MLNTLVKADTPEPSMTSIVRWLMAVRKGGRWGNTQENAYAMESLVNYYRKHETVVPNFSAVVKLGLEEVAREQFTGRSADAKSTDLSMPRRSRRTCRRMQTAVVVENHRLDPLGDEVGELGDAEVAPLVFQNRARKATSISAEPNIV